MSLLSLRFSHFMRISLMDVMKSVLGNLPVHFFTIHIHTCLRKLYRTVHRKFPPKEKINFLGKCTGDTSCIVALQCICSNVI